MSVLDAPLLRLFDFFVLGEPIWDSLTGVSSDFAQRRGAGLVVIDVPKRDGGAEFAVEGDAPPENKEIKPEPAESKPSTSGASSSSWNGAADLDDLEGENDKEKAAAKAEEPPEKKAKTEDPNRDEVADGAPRLAQHIQSASKFNKVAAMAYALLESNRVTRSNAGAFFAVLEGAMANPLQLRDKTYRVAYRK